MDLRRLNSELQPESSTVQEFISDLVSLSLFEIIHMFNKFICA